MAKAEKKAAKKDARRKRRGGFVLGAVVGAVTGLLLAPKAGKEMRAQLFGEGGIGAQVDRLKGAAGVGGHSGASQGDELKRKIEETRERLRAEMGEAGEGAGGDAPRA